MLWVECSFCSTTTASVAHTTPKESNSSKSNSNKWKTNGRLYSNEKLWQQNEAKANEKAKQQFSQLYSFSYLVMPIKVNGRRWCEECVPYCDKKFVSFHIFCVRSLLCSNRFILFFSFSFFIRFNSEMDSKGENCCGVVALCPISLSAR